MKNAKFTTSTIIALLFIIFTGFNNASAQSCTVRGNQTTYGTNNTWIGYVYRGMNFDTYKGYVTEGSATSADFDESFGGDVVTYSTTGCSVNTEDFSVRYRLTKTFADGNYVFTVGGDDGYRLSLDGGATWAITNWNEHSYATSVATIRLNGTYNMVLEYYEHQVNNRISIKIVAPACTPGTNTTTYGSGSWIGYVYTGANFDTYKGSVTEGSSLSANFDEDFGGDNATYNTSGCPINTNGFSVRFKMKKTLQSGKYFITVGGDDGYRLSLDGGSTWVISKWQDQSYATSTYSANLSGSYNIVLEYYENSGSNRISFDMSNSILPIKLLSFTGEVKNATTALLNWKCAEATNFSHFTIQKSTDGREFKDVASLDGKNQAGVQSYTYSDRFDATGTLYYRLAMVDIDGTVVYSPVIALSGKSAAAAATKIYPTVIENGSLFVDAAKLPAQAKLEIFDMNGKSIFSKQLAQNGKQQVIFGTQGIRSTGAYVARISGGNEVVLSQLIVIK